MDAAVQVQALVGWKSSARLMLAFSMSLRRKSGLREGRKVAQSPKMSKWETWKFNSGPGFSHTSTLSLCNEHVQSDPDIASPLIVQIRHLNPLVR